MTERNDPGAGVGGVAVLIVHDLFSPDRTSLQQPEPTTSVIRPVQATRRLQGRARLRDQPVRSEGQPPPAKPHIPWWQRM